MTKQEFLFQLRLQLSGLPQLEVDDIIRDQEELIRDALAAGRTEESVITALGSPADLARNLKSEIKIEHAEEQIKKAEAQFTNTSNDWSNNSKALLSAVGAVLVLAPFNLIFVLGPFLALMGILFTGWAIAIAMACVGLSLLGVLLVSIAFAGFSPLIYLACFFVFAGLMFLGFTFCGVMALVTTLVMKLVVKYLKWNIKFITKS